MKNECVEFLPTKKLTEEEAVAEDEGAFKERGRTVIEVPVELMPVILEVIAQYQARVKT